LPPGFEETLTAGRNDQRVLKVFAFPADVPSVRNAMNGLRLTQVRREGVESGEGLNSGIRAAQKFIQPKLIELKISWPDFDNQSVIEAAEDGLTSV
jgi:hypothetical protein